MSGGYLPLPSATQPKHLSVISPHSGSASVELHLRQVLEALSHLKVATLQLPLQVCRSRPKPCAAFTHLPSFTLHTYPPEHCAGGTSFTLSHFHGLSRLSAQCRPTVVSFCNPHTVCEFRVVSGDSDFAHVVDYRVAPGTRRPLQAVGAVPEL